MFVDHFRGFVNIRTAALVFVRGIPYFDTCVKHRGGAFWTFLFRNPAQMSGPADWMENLWRN